MPAMTDRPPAKLKDPVEYLRGTAQNLELACAGEDPEFGEIPLDVAEATDIIANLRDCAECIEQLQGQVAALQEHHRDIGQHLLDTHKPGEVDEQAVAILDGYHVGAREVAGGGQGEPGETTLQAALRLLKLAHQRGAFALTNPPAEPGWTGGEVIDAAPAIRCWPAVGVVFAGPDGPVLSIDPQDGGNVALVHIGDVAEYQRSSDFALLMLKHKAVMRKVAEARQPTKETP